MTTGSSPRRRRSSVLVAVGAALCLPAGCAAQPGSEATPGTPSDWRNATYSVTCDGIVPGGLPVTLVDGAARVRGDPEQEPHYKYYDVQWQAHVTGDVDGDGEADAVVLLQCSPQPSNGLLQEVHVYTADGERLGVLPSPRTLREGTILAPVYDPSGLAVEDGEIVAAMEAYAPEDSHASGPSVPITVSWQWDGRGFARVE